jgi:hypothetical protein
MIKFNHAFLTVAVLLGPSMTWAQRAPSDQVSFYEVPLRCPASRNLGCGSASKPILLALEKKSPIQEAWLNYPGTTLAIVWKKSTTPEQRAAEMRSEREEWHMPLPELTGNLRGAILSSFESDKAWYRGAEVDQLSAEEANIIVDRWIRRAATKVPSIASKSDSLKPAVAKVIRDRFTGKDTGSDGYPQRLQDAARKSLTDSEFTALMEAGMAKRDYRPVGDEQ